MNRESECITPRVTPNILFLSSSRPAVICHGLEGVCSLWYGDIDDIC
jgi:hypothetical protein